MRAGIWTALAVLAGGTVAQAAGEREKNYVSPDGALHARVLAAGKLGTESRPEIRWADGSLVCDRSWGSPDGEHGLAVVHAGWTPDSQFFVVSTTSSGGHSPWHFPTYYFRRKQANIASLDDRVGPITSAQFKLSAPDVFRGRRKVGPDIQGQTFRVALGKVGR